MRHSLISAARAMREGRVTARELLEDALLAAERHANLNAISHTAPDTTRSTADNCDDDARRGKWRGPLHGLPISVKDLFKVYDWPMSASTRAQLPRMDSGDAEVVKRLKAAGAIVFAKANMHEIALGITGELGQGGPVCNPHNTNHQSGGSSSGSAACVAAGIGLASVGSDTACSIRLPAAYCGVVGFKPTFGHVPLEGALPLSWSFDHGGPITQTVEDAALLYGVLSAREVNLPPQGERITKLGLPMEMLLSWLGPEVRPVWDAFLRMLEGSGIRLMSVSSAMFEHTQECFNLVRDPEALFVHREQIQRDPNAFSPAVRDFLLRGTGASAQSYFEGLQLQKKIRVGHAHMLENVDALLLPTAPWPAPKIGQTHEVLERGPVALRDGVVRLTAPFNISGVPALSLPFARVKGLPLGVQLIGEFGGDVRLLALARWLQNLIGYQPV